jgi:hypothetical protein
MMIRPLFRTAFVLAASVSIAGCGLEAQSIVEGGFERVLPAGEGASLDVRTGSGSITVTNGPAGSITIAARIRGRSRAGRNVEARVRQIEAAPPVQEDGGTIRIGHGEDRELLRDISISYDIVAPADILLVAQTGSGDQRIEGVRGPVAATTGSGGITLRNIQMDVRAATGAGDIRTENVGGSFEGRTGSGSIEIDGIGGAMRARTAAGDIRVDGRPGGNWDVDSTAGSIHIRVPPDSRFELDARTTAGSVRVDAPVTMVQSSARRAGSAMRVRGTAGGGGPRLEISTLAGSIQID